MHSAEKACITLDDKNALQNVKSILVAALGNQLSDLGDGQVTLLVLF